MIVAKDIMTKDVVSVAPETRVSDAANILAMHHFDGMPVTNLDNTLVGIITEYDLLSHAAVHLPTFQLILQSASIFQQDQEHLQGEVEQLSRVLVRDVLNPEPLTFSPDTTYEEVVQAFAGHHRVNPVPVVDGANHVVGVISRYDVLRPLRGVKE